MKAHDWFIEHRLEFASRLLDPEDEAAFREHLPRCEACRAEVERIEEELRLLPMAVTPVPLKPGLNRRMVEYAVGAAHGRPRARWYVAAAIACLLCGTVGWQAGVRHATVPEVDEVLQEKLTLDGKEGGVVIFADARTHRWNVVMHGLPAAPPGMRYTFWFITKEEGMVRDQDVPFDPVKPAMFTTSMPAHFRVMGGALTLEPESSVTGPPQGKHLVHLML